MYKAKNCDDLSVKWFQLLFRKIKLTWIINEGTTDIHEGTNDLWEHYCDLVYITGCDFDQSHARLSRWGITNQYMLKTWYAVFFFDTVEFVCMYTLMVLGCHRHFRYKWLSAASRQLIEKKRKAWLYNDHAGYKRLTKQCRKSVKQDKQRWADAKAGQQNSSYSVRQRKMPLTIFMSFMQHAPRFQAHLSTSMVILSATSKAKQHAGSHTMNNFWINQLMTASAQKDPEYLTEAQWETDVRTSHYVMVSYLFHW